MPETKEQDNEPQEESGGTSLAAEKDGAHLSPDEVSKREQKEREEFERRARITEIRIGLIGLIVTIFGFGVVIYQLMIKNDKREFENAILAIEKMVPDFVAGRPTEMDGSSNIEFTVPVENSYSEVSIHETSVRILDCDGKSIHSEVRKPNWAQPDATIVPGVAENIKFYYNPPESVREKLEAERRFIVAFGTIAFYADFERLGVSRTLAEDNSYLKKAFATVGLQGDPVSGTAPSLFNSLTLRLPIEYLDGTFSSISNESCRGRATIEK